MGRSCKEAELIVGESMPEGSEPAAQRRPFVVVMRGSSSLRFGPRAGVTLTVSTADGEVLIRAFTNWVESGFAHPLPRELLIEVRVRAHTVDEALGQARGLSTVLLAAASFAGNGWIGDVEPHLVYEATPGVSNREFVEYFVADQSGPVSPSREVNAGLVSRIVEAVFQSAHREGVSRALAHYHEGLRHYHAGGEALALGHVFMAAEALREAALDSYCRRTGRSEAEIRAAEGHENRGHLLAWARREIIFAADHDTHRAAKKASDGMEHGHLPVGAVRALAESVCDAAFTHVRRAIADLIEIPAEARNELLERFGKPADTRSLGRRVVGSLIGEGDELAAPGSRYPVLEWNSSIASFDIDAEGMPHADVRDRFTVRTAEGLGFQLRRLEVYGRPDPDAQPEHAEMRVQTPEETRARDRVMPALRKVGQAVDACGPGNAGASYSQPVAHLLRLANRAKGIFRGCLSLLESGLAEEALVLGRQLFREAMRLHEAACAAERERAALAFGWLRDSAAAAAAVISPEDPARSEAARRGAEEEVRIREAAGRFGVTELRSFAEPRAVAEALAESPLADLDRLAECMEQGWLAASSSRCRTREEGVFELHDVAPDSWVYPAAAIYIGGSYLIVGQASLLIFGWEDSVGRLRSAESELAPFIEEAGGGPGT